MLFHTYVTVTQKSYKNGITLILNWSEHSWTWSGAFEISIAPQVAQISGQWQPSSA